jgi:hypothetical protein
MVTQPVKILQFIEQLAGQRGHVPDMVDLLLQSPHQAQDFLLCGDDVHG